MIRKGAQITCMIGAGTLVLLGLAWVVVHRPGFLPSHWTRTALVVWHQPWRYQLLGCLDVLGGAWVFGWIVANGAGWAFPRSRVLQGWRVLRPPRGALVALFFLHVGLLLVDRPNGTPAVVLSFSSRWVSVGEWMWASFAIGGNVACLAFLLCSLVVSLWSVSGAFGGPPAGSGAPTPSSSRLRRVRQIALALGEAMLGFIVLLAGMIGLQALSHMLGHSPWFLQENLLRNLRSDIGGVRALAWPALILSVAALAWGLGVALRAVVLGWLPARVRHGRPGDSAASHPGRVFMALLLAVESVLAVVLQPEKAGRFFIQFSDGTWWFALDLWLAMAALVAIGMAFMFVGESFAVWQNRGRRGAVPIGS
jgi:hypothetical protein